MNFICPLCRMALNKYEKSLKCENGHCFDICKHGYVNLLQGGGAHGDNKDMVLSRNKFLESGYYSFLRDSVSASAAVSGGGVFLDSGCGEGYYTEKIAQALECDEVFGVDISKDALRLAAKRLPKAGLAVASVYSLPIESSSLDIVTSIFSPFAGEEFHRVLKSGGTLISVIPGKFHLFGLKSLIYDKPYENEIKPYEEEGFEFISSEKIKNDVTIDGDEAKTLWKMTPYYYRTPKEGLERLEKAESVKTPLEFEILKYIKK